MTINTDRAFICLAIAEREQSIRNGRKMIDAGKVSADLMPTAMEYLSGLEAQNVQVRAHYGIGKVKALGA